MNEHDDVDNEKAEPDIEVSPRKTKSKRKSGKKRPKQNLATKQPADPSGLKVSSRIANYNEPSPLGLTVPLTHVGGSENEEEKEPTGELLQDTFSFLMMSKNPLDWCFHGKQEVDETQRENIESAKIINKEISFSNISLLGTESVINGKEGMDQDAMFLPFWTGVAILSLQLFIYSVVIMSVFANDQIPPNADATLRPAQVSSFLRREVFDHHHHHHFRITNYTLLLIVLRSTCHFIYTVRLY